MRMRRRWAVVWGIGAVVATGALITIMMGQSANLLNKATRVAGPADRIWSNWIFPSAHGWLSDHELFMFKKGSDYKPVGVVRDIRTGKERVLPGLSGVPAAMCDTADVSPDGRRILWAAPGSEFQCVDLAGRVLYHGPRQFPFNASWHADGRHWVSPQAASSTRPAGITVHEDGSSAVRFVPLPAMSMSPFFSSTDAEGRLVVRGNGTQGGLRGNEVHLARIDLRPAQPTVHEEVVRLPSEYSAMSVVACPENGRLAWVCRRMPSMWAKPALVPLLILLHAPQAQGEVLLVTDAHGHGARELGFVADKPAAEAGGVTLIKPIAALRWMPGGKSLSFTYDGSIWTVPAD